MVTEGHIREKKGTHNVEGVVLNDDEHFSCRFTSLGLRVYGLR
jgi:hypothetical protein